MKAKSEIDTPAKRAKLAPRRNPYFAGVSGGRGGVSLGYRRAARGPGVWIAKLVIDRRRVEERLAPADDAGAPAEALPYQAAISAALTWARQRFATIEASSGVARLPDAPTVRSAVEAYGLARKARLEMAGRDAVSRLKKHVLADEALAATKLAKLTSRDLAAWRERLPDSLAPATVNRLLNDLRAALNAAAEADRRSLPPGLPGEIKAGTKAIAGAENGGKAILTQAEIRSIVEAAYEVDETGDFGRLVALAAATGARFSQLARLTVGDVQVGRSRIMVPASRKGRTNKPVPSIAVPVGADILDRMRPILAGRKASEPLLLRWVHRQVGPAAWEREVRKPWSAAADTTRPWVKARDKAKLPDVPMMSLRHSSIVRALQANLPVRLVAALHDTSITMIEKHYSAFIVDASEELARRAVLSLAS